LPLTAGGQEAKPAGDPKVIVARLLKDLEQTGDVPRQVQAAQRLADFGARAEPAIAALVKALDNKAADAGQREDLRLNAAIALGKIGKAAVPALRALLD